MSTTIVTPVAVAAPTPQHHFNLGLFLQILAAIAPSIAAPFVPAGLGTQVFQASSTGLSALSQILQAEKEVQ